MLKAVPDDFAVLAVAAALAFVGVVEWGFSRDGLAKLDLRLAGADA